MDAMVDLQESLREAKLRLPLPELMQRLGLGDRSKASARCPFHEDKNPSFGIFQNEGRWAWKCHAGCGGGDEIDFLAKREGLVLATAIQRFKEMAGVNGTSAEPQTKRPGMADQWEQAVLAFSANHVQKFSEWRGYSMAFCEWLKNQKLIGWHKGLVACPIHNERGHVAGIHFRQKDGSWRVDGGCGMQPLVIGNPEDVGLLVFFESQWDAFAFLDRMGAHRELGFAVVVTRGAGNGAMAARWTETGQGVIAFPQNDPGDDGKQIKARKWLADIVAHSKAEVRAAAVPAQYKDLNDWTRAGADKLEINQAIHGARLMTSPSPPQAVSATPLIEFFKPSDLKNYTPPPGLILVGDCHVTRGAVFAIGGAPGVGKSRASVALAVAGATQQDWFGLKVHRKFKTMILQTENGRFRLSKEFGDLDAEQLDEWVRVCPPPPYGLAFSKPGFSDALRSAILEFKPDVLILDPWNAAARDDRQKDYLETFETLRGILPVGDEAPALGIVAHTRKPQSHERANGRGLLNLLAGSYVLASVPRSVFVVQAASDDTEDLRVVWTCCKNNDGEMGPRSAWERRNGLFAPVSDFGWDEFENPDQDAREKISERDVAGVFEHGRSRLKKAEAARRLQDETGAGRTACYDALRLDGRFSSRLAEENGLLKWVEA